MTGRIIGELRGHHYDFSISSDGNELLIEYYSRNDTVIDFEYQVLVAEEQHFLGKDRVKGTA